MREIKFRAWDKEDKQMHEVDMLQWSDTLRVTCNGEYHEPNEKYELMQYTGFKDCNGNEVYEGDIIKTDESLEIIEWNEALGDAGCTYGSGWSICSDGYHKVTGNIYEVIGNIYENPELLK